MARSRFGRRPYSPAHAEATKNHHSISSSRLNWKNARDHSPANHVQHATSVSVCKNAYILRLFWLRGLFSTSLPLKNTPQPVQHLARRCIGDDGAWYRDIQPGVNIQVERVIRVVVRQ